MLPKRRLARRAAEPDPQKRQPPLKEIGIASAGHFSPRQSKRTRRESNPQPTDPKSTDSSAQPADPNCTSDICGRTVAPMVALGIADSACATVTTGEKTGPQSEPIDPALARVVEMWQALPEH